MKAAKKRSRTPDPGHVAHVTLKQERLLRRFPKRDRALTALEARYQYAARTRRQSSK